MKKRIHLLLLLMLSLSSWAAAQTFSVSFYGTVTETGSGNPIANHDVYIMFDSMSHNYFNVVQTDANGNFSDVATGVGSMASAGNAYVFLYDCNNQYVGSGPLAWSSVNNSFTNTFQICNSSSSNCTAQFNASQVQGTTIWNFADLSSAGSPAASVNSWFWDFGDGNTSTLQNPSHAYNISGPVRVCLTIGTTQGCTATYCDSLITTGGGGGGSCMAGFQAIPGALGCNVAFYDSSFSSNPPMTYTWSFGDGSTGTGANPNHTYAASGSYTACLTIADANGCTDTYCQTITVTCGGGGGGGCQAGYYWYPDTSGQYSIIIVNTSTGNNLSYLWTFGDGSSSTQMNPSHVYNGPGAYVVCVTVTDNSPANACTSTFCDSLLVLNRMSVPFSINVIGGTVGMDERSSLGMTLSPNPSSDRVVLSFEATEAAETQVTVTDLNGRVLRTVPLGLCRQGSNGHELSLGELPAGLYLLRVQSGDKQAMKKLILVD